MTDIAESHSDLRGAAGNTDLAGEVDYHAAVATASDDDRRYATEIGAHMITTVKLFTSLRARLQALPDADQWAGPLLHRLMHFGPQRASDLADALSADPSTISRQVAAMVKSRLVERQADPDDGRASILVLTEAGRERFAEFGRMRGRMMSPLIAGWTPAERATFLDLTERFNESLTQCLEPMKETVTAYAVGRPGRESNEH